MRNMRSCIWGGKSFGIDKGYLNLRRGWEGSKKSTIGLEWTGSPSDGLGTASREAG